MNARLLAANPETAFASRLAALGRQSMRYAIVSGLALACDVGIYAAGVKLSGLVPPAAGAIGYAMGLFVHYALASQWVFPDPSGERRTVATFGKFAASGVMGLAMTTAVIGGLTTSGMADAFSAKAVAVVTTFVVVFLVRRSFVFVPHRPR